MSEYFQIMSEYFTKNIIYLRNLAKENQTETAMALGLTRSTLANYEVGENLPKLDVVLKIIGHFNISFDDLMYKNLENVHLSQKSEELKNGENVHLNVRPNVHLNAQKEQKEQTTASPLKDDNTALKDDLIRSKNDVIDSLKAQISLLQNKIDQMQYDTTEREQKQHTQRKEARSA